jgi:hypothetical protein
LLSRYWLGTTLTGQARHDEALAVLAPAAELAPRVLGPTHSYTGMIDVERARALRGVGDATAADALLADILTRAPEAAGEASWRRVVERAEKLRAEWAGAGRSGQ